MKKVLALAFMLSGFLFIVSCDDEKEPVDLAEPTVTAPSATSVQVGTTVELTFTFAAEAGFTSSDVSSTGGTASITTDGTAGATTGSIVVSFVAASTSGAGSVTVEVTDAEGDSEDAVVILTVTESSVPSIEGIPATATVGYGAMLEVSDVELTAEDGFASFEVSVDDEAAIDLTELVTVGETSATVDISFPTEGLEAGNHTLEFTLEDGDGDAVSLTHVLTIMEFPTKVVLLNISSNVTWSADTVYELGGRITVLNNATLTIEAGTIVKGQAGSGTNATALMVARGGKLIADGTSDAPIIFTSAADEILPGEVESPNLDVNANGLWGGIVILGKAPIYAATAEAQIEGVPTSDTNGLFGGTVADDNSGILRYVSLRHGGSVISGGNEINGLSLGGVGSGTIIENIEIVSNVDDGIEIWGGTVDLSGVLVWNSSDDALDTDYGWSGTVSDFMVINPINGGSAFELDGPEAFTGTLPAGTCFTFINGVVYAPAAYNLVDWDGDTNGEVKDVYFFGMPATYTIATADGTTDANDGPIKSYNGNACGTSNGWEVTSATGVSVAAVFGTVTAAEVTTAGRTVGPDADDFAWTLCATSGTLAAIGL